MDVSGEARSVVVLVDEQRRKFGQPGIVANDEDDVGGRFFKRGPHRFSRRHIEPIDELDFDAWQGGQSASRGFARACG